MTERSLLDFHRLRPACVALATAALAPLAQAQLIDDIALRQEGPDVVATIQFNATVQFRRAAVPSGGTLLQAYYDVVSSQGDLPRVLEQERRFGPSGSLPAITVTDQNDQTNTQRRLVIRMSRPVTLEIRQGTTNRSIDLVIRRVTLARVTPPAPAANVAGAARPVAPAPSAPAAATPPAAAPATGATPGAADVEARAAELMTQARQAQDRGETQLAVESLNEVLNLPPHSRSAEAQARIGQARLANGDAKGARAEFELYLQLYPEGAEAESVRAALQALPAPEATTAAAPGPARADARPAVTTITGGVSFFYYGGQSTSQQALKDTPLEGLPTVVSTSTLSGTDQKQLISSMDFNWRSRDDVSDARFVFRDSYTSNFLPGKADLHKPTALYYDYKSLDTGLGARVGRQSGLGGGVLGRFDGALLSWNYQPKQRVNVVMGKPVDLLLDTRRSFMGASLDLEQITQRVGASFYTIEQRIDGQVDRQALGTEWRFFSPSFTAFSQFEYDVANKGVNIAAVQGTYTFEDASMLNLLFDRRATPLLSLGNALFFADPTLTTLPRTVTELLATSTLADLRQRVRSTTAYATQALIGYTHPIKDSHWQMGTDLRLTNVGAIDPVPGILPNGIPSTGNVWSTSVQAIGTNLYSARDTHVYIATLLRAPTYNGILLSYNNLSTPAERWTLEPVIRFYRQTSTDGTVITRWTPGLRVTWRGGPKWAIESDFTLESSRTRGPTQEENARRYYYYVGLRYDF
jgi:hypothetical protein